MVYNASGGQNVHVDVALTNVSIGFPNNGFVGSAFLPPVPVKKQSDKYYVFGKELFTLHPGGDLRAPGTQANEIDGLQLSLVPYFAQEHALQVGVTDEERENADSPLRPDTDGAELVTQRLLLQREVYMKDLLLTAANYNAANTVTLSGTSQWSDYANSDPINDIKNGKRAIHAALFLEPNVIAIPYQVMSKLEDHPDFIERIKYSERGILTEEIIAAVIGISNVVTAGIGINSANPGQAVSLGYLWGKDVLMAYVPPRPGMKVPAFGYEFVWTYDGRVQVVDRWREENRGRDVLRVRRRYDLKLTTVDVSDKSIAGYLIKAAVA